MAITLEELAKEVQKLRILRRLKFSRLATAQCAMTTTTGP